MVERKKEHIQNIKEILTKGEHSSLRNAVLSDAWDIIPVVGDVSNVLRIADRLKVHRREYPGMFKEWTGGKDIREVLKERGPTRRARMKSLRRKKVGMQGADTLMGLVPGPIGIALDAVTLTNTIHHFQRQGKLKVLDRILEK